MATRYTTNCNPRYFRSRLCEAVEYNVVSADGILQTIRELDPYSEELQYFLSQLTQFDSIEYHGEQLTTLVYRYYGNTTLIWLVLLVNGLLSRTELREGMVLQFPLLGQINQAAQTVRPLLQQTDVVI